MLNNYLVVYFHKRDTNQKLSVCSLWDYNISISMKFVTKEAIQYTCTCK